MLSMQVVALHTMTNVLIADYSYNTCRYKFTGWSRHAHHWCHVHRGWATANV